MESRSIFNSSSFSYNETTFTGQNQTLQFPLPVWTITALTFCSVGILANSLIICVIIFSSLRTSVFMNLLMILGFFDILFLLTVIDLQPGLFGHLFHPSEVHCSLNNYLRLICGLVSSWVTVFLTLERFVVIYFPFKVHIYCTKAKTCATVIVLTILSCFCLVPSFYFSTVGLSDPGPTCKINLKGNLQMIFMLSLVFVYNIVPALLIVVLNISIMRKLKLQRAFRLRSVQYSKSLNNASQVTIMVCVCSIFVSTSIPATIVIFAFYSTGCSISFPEWLFHCSYLLDNINHSLNFFLYCLTGSVFRQALFKLFSCKDKESKECHVHQQIAISQSV